MSNLDCIFDKELTILNKFVYRIKNEHNSTMVYRKIVHLKRLIDKTKDTRIIIEGYKIQKCCIDLYTVATSYLNLGHYISFTYLVLGMAARFFFLVEHIYIYRNIGDKNLKNEAQDEINNIFD